MSKEFITKEEFLWLIEHGKEIDHDVAAFKKGQPLIFFTTESIIKYIGKFQHFFMMSQELKDKLTDYTEVPLI